MSAPLCTVLPATAQGVEASAVESELRDILARPGFHPEENVLDGLAGILSDLFGSVLSSKEAEGLVWFGAFVVAALLAGLIVVHAWRSRAAHTPRGAGAPGGGVDAERRRDVEALRRAAAEARAAGDLRGALRLTWFALVVGLGQRGVLAYRDAWTNRELLERGQPEPEARALLEPALAEIEVKEFGHAATTEADVERLDELCRRALSLEPLRASRGTRSPRAARPQQAGGTS